VDVPEIAGVQRGLCGRLIDPMIGVGVCPRGAPFCFRCRCRL
jgi:hypothetical protein